MYHLSELKLKRAILEAGYANIADFSAKTGINRNTLYSYLRGHSVFLKPFEQICASLKIGPLNLLEAVDEVPEGYPAETLEYFGSLAGDYTEICFCLFRSKNRPGEKRLSDWDIGVASLRGQIDEMLYNRLKGKIHDWFRSLSQKPEFVNLDKVPEWFLASILGKMRLAAGNAMAYSRLERKCRAVREVRPPGEV